ncbi:MAG: undecaprenyl-diphosphatase [Patescibacteria group bacterium]|jgi:undecaprenyl-diphosphatase|nr:undecaprenyl-diphosphatase [Patescibacteria group bacterium]
MTVLQAIVLGAVQGLTEFLPVSSSGHLILVPALLGWSAQPLAFDLIIHIATLFAVVIALRTDILWLWEGLWKRDKARIQLAWKLAAATVPALAVGFAFNDWLEGFRGVQVVAVSLIVWGFLLGLADRFSAMMRGQVKDLGKILWWQAMLIGIIQICSFIPGTSRSGSTMTAGLFSGLDRVAAARFSFLLAIPVTAAAGASALLDVTEHGLDVTLLPMLAGFASAFLFGILAIRLLLIVVKNASFMWFAVYRIALGVFILFYL